MYGCRSTCESTCVYIYVRVCVRVYMRTCRYMCVCCVSCYSCDVAFPFVRCAGWHNIICIRPICEPLILNKWELLWTNLTFLLLFWSRLVTSCPTCSASKHTHTHKQTQFFVWKRHAENIMSNWRSTQRRTNEYQSHQRVYDAILFLTERKVHSL